MFARACGGEVKEDNDKYDWIHALGIPALAPDNTSEKLYRSMWMIIARYERPTTTTKEIDKFCHGVLNYEEILQTYYGETTDGGSIYLKKLLLGIL